MYDASFAAPRLSRINFEPTFTAFRIHRFHQFSGLTKGMALRSAGSSGDWSLCQICLYDITSTKTIAAHDTLLTATLQIHGHLNEVGAQMARNSKYEDVRLNQQVVSTRSIQAS